MNEELEQLRHKNDAQLVTFHMDRNLYNRFNEFSKEFGFGAKRKILEMALKQFMEKAK